MEKNKSDNQLIQYKILEIFTNHEKKLSNCLMIMLQLNLKLNTNIFWFVKDLKY